MKRRLYAILLGGLVLAGGLSGCRGRTSPGRPGAGGPGGTGAEEPERPPATVTGKARGIRLVMPDAKGRPLYEVRSKASVQSQAEKMATFTDSVVTLYHEGRPDVIVSAPNVKVSGDTRKLIMWGGITARAPARRLSFHVERLTWDYTTKRFEGTGGVHLTQPPLSMRADRLSGKTPVHSVDLTGHVQLDMAP